jgi:hypothetical protein
MTIIGALALCGCKPPPAQEPSAPAPEGGGAAFEKVHLELALMSRCEHGNDLLLSLPDFLEKMGDRVELSISYLGKVNDDGTLSCPHGQPEIEGNAVQLCAAEHFPDGYLSMSVCMAGDVEAIPDNWKSCAQEAGLDTAAIETCASGEEGLELLKASFAHSMQIGARASPDVIVNGDRHTGCRSAKALEALVCDALPEAARPDGCPSFPDVHLTIISDPRCEPCSKIIEKTNASLEFLIKKLEIETLEWSEASTLAQEAQITHLPAYVFGSSLSRDPCFDYLSKDIVTRGEHLVFDRGEKWAPFDPTE